MAIDLLNEATVSLGDARRDLIPRKNGKPISPATLYRWIDQGVRAGDGSRVKFPAVRIGRDLVTTRESVKRFFDELMRRSGYQPPAADDGELPAETEHQLRAAGLLPDSATASGPNVTKKKTAQRRRSPGAAKQHPVAK